MYTNQDIVFLWALLIIWDARTFECVIQCRLSSEQKLLSNVDAHLGTCHPGM